MSLNSKQQDELDDMFYDIRLQLENLVSKKYGTNVAATVEQHLTDTAEAILKAVME